MIENAVIAHRGPLSNESPRYVALPYRDVRPGPDSLQYARLNWAVDHRHTLRNRHLHNAGYDTRFGYSESTPIIKNRCISYVSGARSSTDPLARILVGCRGHRR